MGLSVRLLPEAVRTLAFGTIGAAYMGVGTAFANPVRLLLVQNVTDATLMFSFNGVDDHLPLPRDGYMLLDVTANKSIEAGMYFAEGTRLYVKEVGTPTSGSVYVTTFYGSKD